MLKLDHLLLITAVLASAAYAGFYTFNYFRDGSMVCHASIGQLTLPLRKGAAPNLIGNVRINFPAQGITLVAETALPNASHIQRNAHIHAIRGWNGKIVGVRIVSSNISPSESGTVGQDYSLLAAGSIYPYSSRRVADHISLTRLGLLSFFCEHDN